MGKFEKKLFKKVKSNFEKDCFQGKAHIIDVSDEEDETSYRIYHTDGYSFEVSKIEICDKDETDEFDIYDLDDDGNVYSYYDLGVKDGFNNCEIKKAEKIIENLIY